MLHKSLNTSLCFVTDPEEFKHYTVVSAEYIAVVLYSGCLAVIE